MDTEKKESLIKVGTTVIVYKGSEIYLLLNKVTNEWELPGGTLDEGETLVECAKRELKEEANISVDDVKFINYIEHSCRYDTNKLWLNMIYSARYPSEFGFNRQNPKASDEVHSDGKWFKLNQLPGNMWSVALNCINLWRQ